MNLCQFYPFFLLPVSLIPFQTGVAAEAITAKTINGSYPELKIKIKQNNEIQLVNVKLKEDVAQLATLELPEHSSITALSKDTYQLDIQGTVPFSNIKPRIKDQSGNDVLADGQPHLLSRLAKFWDADGDAPDPSSPIIGYFQAQWQDRYNNTVNVNSMPRDCFSPYQLTVTVSPIMINSQYGDPKSLSLPGITNVYKVLFDTDKRDKSSFCYIQPALQPDNSYTLNGVTYPKNSQWSSGLGFLPQADSVDNFPTTGFNGATFDLYVNNIDDARNEQWQVEYSPRNDQQKRITVKVIAVAKNRIQVKLQGPYDVVKPISEKGKNVYKFMPRTVTIAAKGKSLSYSFTIRKWFYLAGSQSLFMGGTSLEGCDMTYYRFAQTRDMVFNPWYPYSNPQSSTIPKFNGWDQTRPAFLGKTVRGIGTQAVADSYNVIGGGLLSEWGNIKAFFPRLVEDPMPDGIWSVNEAKANNEYATVIDINTGGVMRYNKDNTGAMFFCVSK